MLFYERVYVGIIALFACHRFCSLIDIILQTYDIARKKSDAIYG